MSNDNEQVRGQPSLSEYSTAWLGYPANRSDALAAPQVATNLLRDMTDAGVFERYSQIFFVSHSLGGIITRQMIVAAAVAQTPLANKVAGVFLIASPSSGAPAANFISALPRAVGGRIVVDLKSVDNSYLISLQGFWHDYLRRNVVPTYCAHETQPVLGLLVVPQVYTDAFCSENPFAANANHLNIVKPNSRDAETYKWVRGRLAEVSLRKQGAQPTRAPDQPSVVPSPPPVPLQKIFRVPDIGAKDGQGNTVATLSDISVTVDAQKFFLSYNFYNGSGTQKGSQTIVLTFRGAGGIVLAAQNFGLDRSRCIYNGPERRNHTANVNGSAITSVEMSVTNVAGRQGRC